MSEWQPIETAPHGWENAVDLWGGYKSNPKRRITDCRRHDVESDWCRESEEFGWTRLSGGYEITHWMPPPPPPATLGALKNGGSDE